MKYLLGFENVKNYDGSWTEWGQPRRCAGGETVNNDQRRTR
jgi:3-mercaptopyruvate sulfurtransferase SseA